MKSMNNISGLVILLVAMAAPHLGGCAVELDSEAATDDDAVAWTDSTTEDAENTGTESQALFGAYGYGLGYGGYGLGCGGYGFGCGGCAIPFAAPFAVPVPVFTPVPVSIPVAVPVFTPVPVSIPVPVPVAAPIPVPSCGIGGYGTGFGGYGCGGW